MNDKRDSSAGSVGTDTWMPSMLRIQVSSDMHWCTKCSSGVRARSAQRKRRSSSRNADHTASVFNRSVSYVSTKNRQGLGSGILASACLSISRAGDGAFVQGLGRDVRSIGPRDRAPVEEESPEVGDVFQRFEDRALQPRQEVHGPRRAVVERHPDAVLAGVLGANNVWQSTHRSLQWRNRKKGLSGCRTAPVGLE